MKDLFQLYKIIERGIKEDLQFSGRNTWVDGKDIPLYGEN